ncbi:transposase, partial [Coraliomargarita sp. SDUM461004]
SCNHRACPQCGGHDQQVWAAKQTARLLPVPYYMLTPTVPQQLRSLFLHAPAAAYDTLFRAASGALQSICAKPKHLGGQAGFMVMLHTWTREMLHHPHVHMIVPAVGLDASGCALVQPRYEGYLVPHALMADEVRDQFAASLLIRHRGLYNQVDPEIWKMKWNVNCQPVGRGKTALRYVAAYVAKSAFNQSRLGGYDADGLIRLWCTRSKDKRRHCLKLKPTEFIRRWLLHVLPRRFVRLRYYGWLSSAAKQAFARVQLLLGAKPAHLELPYLPPMCCAKCEGELVRIQKIHPARGPPLSLGLVHQSNMNRKKNVS